jgi:CheY-like chemotaxis protein
MEYDLDVLVVDDDPDKRMLLMIAVQMAGYRAYTADNGEAALAIAQNQLPDLIIVDALMPNMDGYEMTRRVRSSPRTIYIPVIILSTKRFSPEDMRRGIEAGALGYITDPTDLDLILAWTRTLLDFKSYLNACEAAASESGQYLSTAAVDVSTVNDAQNEKITSILQGKIKAGDFDVFLCHNTEDKPAVKSIGNLLIKQGILPWLDEWNLRPGLPWQEALENQIGQIKSAAVFVGKNGVGPWQRSELNAFLREFIGRGCPVIPVLLEDAPIEPDLPIFFKGMMWVDFRKQDPNPMGQLIWGITGERNSPI